MTRKRITHELVANEAKRNTVLKKRTEGLIKKAWELSTLCGADIAMVFHKKGGESNVLLWPSLEEFEEKLQRFLDFAPGERARKLVTHDKFLEDLLSWEIADLEKMKKVVEETEALQLMAMAAAGAEEGGKPLEQMGLDELQAVSRYAERMLSDLYKRKEELEAAETSAAVEAGQQVPATGNLWEWSLGAGQGSQAGERVEIAQQVRGHRGSWDNFGEGTSRVRGPYTEGQWLVR